MSVSVTDLPVPLPVPSGLPDGGEAPPGDLSLETTVALCVNSANLSLYGALHPSSCKAVKEVDMALSVWYVILLVAMVILNARIVYKLWTRRGSRQREIKRRIDHLVAMLCLSDVLMLIPITLTAYSMGYGRSKFSADSSGFIRVWCSVSSFLFGFSSQLSVIIIMFISLIRFISVWWPVKAAAILSARSAALCMLLSVLVVLGLAIQPYLALEVHYMSNEGICAHASNNVTSTTELFLTSTVPFIIPILISILCLAGIVYRMGRMRRVNVNNNKSERQLYSISMVAVQVIAVFILCFLLWIVDGFVFLLTRRGVPSLYGRAVCSGCVSMMYTRHVSKVFLVYFNCLINPFLYGKLIDIGVEKKRVFTGTSSGSTTRAFISASVASRVNLLRKGQVSMTSRAVIV